MFHLSNVMWVQNLAGVPGGFKLFTCPVGSEYKKNTKTLAKNKNKIRVVFPFCPGYVGLEIGRFPLLCLLFPGQVIGNKVGFSGHISLFLSPLG